MVDADEKKNDAARVVAKELVCEAIAVPFVQDIGVEDWGGEAKGGDVGYYEYREREGEGGDDV
jgi:hypothetical protein